jgi:hypothetical protein
MATPSKKNLQAISLITFSGVKNAHGPIPGLKSKEAYDAKRMGNLCGTGGLVDGGTTGGAT